MTTLSPQELAACPFDHGAARIIPSEPYYPRFVPTWRPQCVTCGANLGEFDTEAEAIAAWNRRSTLPVPKADGGGQPTHRHYKGGLYELIGYGKFEGNLAEAAIYRAENGTIWVRTRVIFDGVVEMEHGEEIRRFEPLPVPPTPADKE